MIYYSKMFKNILLIILLICIGSFIEGGISNLLARSHQKMTINSKIVEFTEENPFKGADGYIVIFITGVFVYAMIFEEDKNPDNKKRNTE